MNDPIKVTADNFLSAFNANVAPVASADKATE
jgi:hypothetical protein